MSSKYGKWRNMGNLKLMNRQYLYLIIRIAKNRKRRKEETELLTILTRMRKQTWRELNKKSGYM
jgi:hypothetical protein